MYLIVIESAASHKQVQLLQKALTNKGLDVLVVCSGPMAVYELSQMPQAPQPALQNMLVEAGGLVGGCDWGIIGAEVAELKKPGELTNLQGQQWAAFVQGMPTKMTPAVQPPSATFQTSLKQGEEAAAADFFHKLAVSAASFIEVAQPIPKAPACPKCGSPEIEEEGGAEALGDSLVCMSCGESFV